MKEQLLPLIPEEETELRDKISNAKDRFKIAQALVERCGTDRDAFDEWMLEVESLFIELIRGEQSAQNDHTNAVNQIDEGISQMDGVIGELGDA